MTKPEQLKKIASVLEIGSNGLCEIELDAVSIKAAGDAMTLFYLLREKLGMDFSYKARHREELTQVNLNTFQE